MSKIGLATYSVQVHEKYHPERREPIRHFATNVDLLDELEAWLNRLPQRPLSDPVAQRVLGLETVRRTNDTLVGRVLAGGFGFTSQLVDVATQAPQYRRRTDDAELIPLYFRLVAPRGRLGGVLALQRFRTVGCQTLFSKGLSESILRSAPDHVVTVRPQVPSEILRLILNGNLKRVTLFKYEVPGDITDAFGAPEYDTREAYLETNVVAPRNKFLPKPRWLVELGNGQRSVADIPQLGNGFDSVKVHLDVGGSVRTVDLSQPHGIRPYMDISREVTLDDGHPTFDSIDIVARELTSEMLGRTGGDFPAT